VIRKTDADSLSAGWAELAGESPSPAALDTMRSYLDELVRWNRTYNLTAIRDPEEMVVRHLLDSLSLLPWVEGPLLDVGTGAGLPGIPLAIARPGLAVTLIDSAGKKVRFLAHVQRTLGLDNICPLHERVENHRPPRPYACIVSRAFSSLADFARACRHLAGPGTRLLAMKGRFPAKELQSVPADFVVQSIEKLTVPGLQEDRHLVIMCHTG
jgi:16S rRNA (guanine527-N7)-methyltransferase